MVPERTTGVYRTYLSFQLEMSKKERELFELEMDLKNVFVCALNLSNDNINSA